MAMHDDLGSVVKGSMADVKGNFFEKLQQSFPVHNAVWKPGDAISDVAFRAGQQSVIDWIHNHASISS